MDYPIKRNLFETLIKVRTMLRAFFLQENVLILIYYV